MYQVDSTEKTKTLLSITNMVKLTNFLISSMKMNGKRNQLKEN